MHVDNVEKHKSITANGVLVCMSKQRLVQVRLWLIATTLYGNPVCIVHSLPCFSRLVYTIWSSKMRTLLVILTRPVSTASQMVCVRLASGRAGSGKPRPPMQIRDEHLDEKFVKVSESRCPELAFVVIGGG